MQENPQSKTKEPKKPVSLSGTKENDEVQKFFLSRKILIRGALVSAVIAVLIVIYLLANKRDMTAGDAQVPVMPGKVIEVEVIDGVGSMKVTQHTIDVLRVLGYDVVEMKKSYDGVVEKSYVFDRSGDLNVARKIASNLGIPDDKVFQKIDRDLYLDVTVVVGKDYLQLKAYQSFIKRKKN